MQLRPRRALAPAVAALALGAALAAAATPDRAVRYPLPIGPVAPEPCPPPPRPPLPPPPPLGRPLVPEASIPAVRAPVRRPTGLAALSGKGMWLTVWPGSSLDVPAIVSMARTAGLHQLWLRTGGTTTGYYGTTLLRALAPAAHRAGVAVIAWDFPTLSDPAADAARARTTLAGGADGFAADIETWSEGTHLTARRVAYYLSLVRAAAASRPVVAVVPRPTPYWLSAYPYRAEAPFVDA